MTGIKIELLVEFAVILLAPIIHTYYLWKFKKVEKKELIKNIKIFASLYLLFSLVGLFLLIK
ncbi:hypothetical protein PHIN5_10970 [Polynucleobacter sp. HIN5]|nr:hypothetical protein PHIN5_10970 [Polynucleobacter sp. HIN5]